MRKILLPLILAMLWSATLASNAWWWSSNDDDNQQQQIYRLQRQTDQQEHSKDTWQIIAFILGIGCVITLVAGAAIGSRARKATKGGNCEPLE